ncbi:hypothetical protein ONS96_004825 [Cadophora gregata f. sp. sojae]|nr:hypothetical protein ONS96_004825 [Cadophora gregata f. sp. sojae]
MGQPEEIPLNYLVDNPLVVIYNGEPTWQSGFLKVGHHLINVALGLAWLILRLLLMFIIWMWNNATFYFPKAQLPEAEQWPAAFVRGLQKLKGLPILGNPRLVIPLLVVLAVLYVLVSLNIIFCWRVIAILRNGRPTTITSPLSDTPQFGVGNERIFAGFQRVTWYHRTIDRLVEVLVLVDNKNHKIVASVTSQGLKVFIVITLGLVLAYRAYRWMGDPMTILVEPNSLEWGSFTGAIRLNLYRAGSLDFFMNAVFITFAVDEYGFKPVSTALGVLLTALVTHLAQAMSLMNRNSEEWHRAANAKPQWAIREHESLLRIISGLLTVFPFMYVLSRQAKRAHRKWLMVPQGVMNRTLLAIIMVIPNLIIAASNRLLYHLGYRLSPMNTPLMLSRRNSSIDFISPNTTPPRTPITPTIQPPSYETFADEEHVSRTPVVPDRKSYRYGISANEGHAGRTPITSIRHTDMYRTAVPEDPDLPASSSLFEINNGSIREITNIIIDIFRTVGSTPQGLLIMFLGLVAGLSLLALVAAPTAATKSVALLQSILGWMPRVVFSIQSHISGIVRWVLHRLSSTFAPHDNTGESATSGPSSVHFRPSALLSPSDNSTSSAITRQRLRAGLSSYMKSKIVSFLRSLVSWIPESLGYASTIYSDLLNAVVTYLESVMGIHTMNSMLLAIIGTCTWAVSNFVNSLRISSWPGATYLAFLSVPVNILVHQWTSYLVRYKFLGINVEDNIYLKWFGIILVLRLSKYLAKYRRTDSFSQLDTGTRPAAYKTSDVTVVIPTKGDYVVNDTVDTGDSDQFLHALGTLLENNPAEVILATSGLEAHKKLNIVAAHCGTHHVKVTSIYEPERNLRHQFLNAINGVTTDIICYAHSNVRWNTNFLKEALKPFNNPEVGLVGVPVNMARMCNNHTYFNAKDYRISYLGLKPEISIYPGFPMYYVTQKLLRFKDWLLITIENILFFAINLFLIDHTFCDHGFIYNLMNFRECIYYGQYNLASAITNSIDDGLEVASAKTALVRTSILQSPDFRFTFPHEKVIGLLPVYGGMRTGAAHFITRKVREMGYKTAFQPTTHVQCIFPVKNGGLISYANLVRDRYSAAYRSNFASLKTGMWLKSPWTAFTLLLSLFHIPMVSDLGLAFLLWLAKVDKGLIYLYGLVVLAYRYRARASHWQRYPRDRAWIVAEPVFWFFESVIQIVALGLALFPETEPEEPEDFQVNPGFKGNWVEHRKMLR